MYRWLRRYAALSAIILVAGCAGSPLRPVEAPPAVAIASAHPLASRAGLETLAAGGNAFDAAVAVSAALAVVEPMSSGLGGGGFWLLHRADDGRQVMIDGRERAPLAAHRDMYLDDDGEVVEGASLNGPLAAGIPGTPAALIHIANHYGRLPMTKSLAPAIRYARDGFAVSERYRRLARFRRDALRASPAAAGVFLDNGEVPAAGHVIRQPELARTLAAIAARGADGFYGGTVARRLVDGVRRAGGIWTLADLESYRVVERKPVRFTYRGVRVASAALPSSGGIVLAEIMNILEGFDLSGMDRARRAHLIVEAMRRAYRDRARALGDPDFVDVDVRRLTSKAYAARLRAGIGARATPSAALGEGNPPRPRGRDTTHFSIIDRAGNRVAATMSINYPFGSGFMPPGTGVVLNDEMDDFSVKPGVPNAYGLIGHEANAVAPGKQPLSSMSPSFLESDAGVVAIGTPGGSRIITMVALAALEFAHGRGTVADWVALPRFHHQYLPDYIQTEPGAFSAATVAKLEALGHTLRERKRTYGNMQAVHWDKTRGRVEAASDPRGEGLAVVR